MDFHVKLARLTEEAKALVPKFTDTTVMAAKKERRRLTRQPGARKMEALNTFRKRTTRTEDVGGDRAEAVVPSESGARSQGHAVLSSSDDVPLYQRYAQVQTAG